MIFSSKCVECALRKEASDDILKAIALRRGMSLKEIRHYLFGRHGLRFRKVDELVKDLKESGFITGSAKRFRIPGLGGSRLV